MENRIAGSLAVLMSVNKKAIRRPGAGWLGRNGKKLAEGRLQSEPGESNGYLLCLADTEIVLIGDIFIFFAI